MTEPRTHHRIVRSRKKSPIPLAKLRTSDAVKTVVDHPRRLQELLRMLEDKDLSVRGRAAVTLSQLSDFHPNRLIRVATRLREALKDESAYVRWHLLYTLGKLGGKFPLRAKTYLPDLVRHLDDENRVCRLLACKALGQIAARRPVIIEECFREIKKDMPEMLKRMMRS